MKNLFFWRFFFQNRNCWHFEFSMNQIFGQRFIIFEKLRCRGLLLLKPRAVEVTTSFHWMSLRSTQKQALENSMKLGNALFWRPLSKEMCAESLQFSTTEWWPCNFFAKLNGNHLLIANIFKLHEYKTFDLIKMHNMSKIWFVNNKFN